MDFVDSVDDPVVFFTDDRDSEIFSRSLATPIAEGEVLEEDERVRIINEIFGAGLAAFGNVGLNPGKPSCDCELNQYQQNKPQDGNRDSCEKSQSSVPDGKATRTVSGMPVLSRRKSNPFYCPSRQIMDLVSKRRKAKGPNLLKSQSSGPILTLNQMHGERKANKRSGAGSSRTSRP
ncbi:hypothetical protein HG536_0B06500 [Torulaspora globosa]|uniref:Uncharacterized protein n=1 Tax=Torulaspora globosa TaxID=48254 RepID=A0A7G3ZE46_9SACH|nr:uncharacterized protein HG536_0B06500 [Torulaspora globosa]QLL31782.1 hypothetical protein HG536_0B06500 [Torulaspora globosa]